MARIRIYEEQVPAGQTAPMPQGIRGVDAGAVGWDSLARAGEQITTAMLRREDEDALAWANTEAANAKLHWLQQFQERQNGAAPGAAGFTTSLDNDFKQDVEKRLSQTSNPRAQRVLRQQLEGFGTSLLGQAITWEDRARTAHRVNLTVAEVDTRSKIVNVDPSQYATEVAAFESGVAMRNLDPIETERLRTQGRRAIAYSAAEGVLARDPSRFVGPQALEATAKTTGRADPVSIINRMIDTKEGTTFVPQDGNSGAPAKFGINQRANPDVDVASLTREGAVDLYVKRYWNAVGANELPADMAQAAFDAAVNMGVPTAKKLLAMAGGDVDKFQELRKAEYRAIVDRNPDQAKYLDGWMRRTDTVSREIMQITPEIPQVPAEAVAGEAFKPDVPGWDDLTLNDQQKIQAQARQALNQRLATDRALLLQQQKDTRAQALAGETPVSRPSLDQYVRQYGEQLGKREYAEDTRYIETGKFLSSVRAMTPDEQVAALGPRPSGASEDAYRLYDLKAKALGEARAELAKDPARYTLAYIPEMRTQRAAMDAAVAAHNDNPTTQTETAMRSAVETYYESMRQQQRRLGVAYPQLFSDAEVDAVAQNLTQPGEQGENVAARVARMEQQYGSAWPELYASMAKKDRLSSMLLVLGTDAPLPAKSRLAEANAANRDAKLEKQFDPETVRGLDEQVRRAMQPFSQTLRFSTGMGVKEEAAFHEQIKLLAMYHMRVDGDSQARAVKRAYTDLVDSQFNFVGTLRLPKNAHPNLPQWMERAKREVTPDELGVPYGSAATPQVREQLWANVQAFGQWVTDETGTGAYLFSGGEAVPGANGRPVYRSFADVTLDGLAAPRASAGRTVTSNAGGAAFVYPNAGRRQ